MLAAAVRNPVALSAPPCQWNMNRQQKWLAFSNHSIIITNLESRQRWRLTYEQRRSGFLPRQYDQFSRGKNNGATTTILYQETERRCLPCWAKHAHITINFEEYPIAIQSSHQKDHVVRSDENCQPLSRILFCQGT